MVAPHARTARADKRCLTPPPADVYNLREGRDDEARHHPDRHGADVARGVTLTKVLDGLDQPVALTFAPGDPQRRLFIVEKKGLVRIVVDGRLQPAAAAFLDLRGRVSGWTEQGLLGLAFHPDFAHTRRVYVNFTDTKGDTRVVEFAARADDPDHADPTSERELLFVKQPYANHNGGDVVFGPDGKLYVGLGDGGSAGDPHGNGQSDATLLGKMFRPLIALSRVRLKALANNAFQAPRCIVASLAERGDVAAAFGRKTSVCATGLTFPLFERRRRTQFPHPAHWYGG